MSPSKSLYDTHERYGNRHRQPSHMAGDSWQSRWLSAGRDLEPLIQRRALDSELRGLAQKLARNATKGKSSSKAAKRISLAIKDLVLHANSIVASEKSENGVTVFIQHRISLNIVSVLSRLSEVPVGWCAKTSGLPRNSFRGCGGKNNTTQDLGLPRA
jgi:hypothetical protein